MDLPFEPMLLHRERQPFADDGWLYQVKWDGVRNLTLVADGAVHHWSRRLRDRSQLFPEFAGLAQVFGGQRAVLDGEIVVLRDGKPNFPAILERDLASAAPDPRKIRSIPATLMIFDLLELGPDPLYTRPLQERLDLLARLVPEAEAWQVVASFPGRSGPDLFAAVVAQGLEGVVAKRLGSPYIPATRSRDWLKVKRRQRTLAVICGFTVPVGRPGGLVLGAYHEGRLLYIGRAGSGITGSDLAMLKAHLPPAPRPFDYEPTLRDRFTPGPVGPVVWTEPRMTVQVDFTEWTEDLKLRDPVVAGFSTEPPEAARIE
ncbi:MAG: ATP-dependent ligase [Firmicutes bacterium]|nr:ATP-dependent ligase [Bacillota bacterium]